MALTRVVTIRGGEPYDFYIGRAGQGESGYFGNPYPKGQACSRCGELHGSPASTLPCFETYFLERLRDDPEFRARVRGLRGRVLGCFCLPGNPCHGAVIANWLNRPEEQINRELDALVARQGG
jgi:hypothetical protein